MVTIDMQRTLSLYLKIFFIFGFSMYIRLILLISLLAPLHTLALPDHKKIGISQIIEHHALDIVRQNMLETLRTEGFEPGKNLSVLYENAQGNLVTSTQIATKFTTLPLDIGIAISTPSAQTLLHAAQKQGVLFPIVFTAVTDPKSAKLTPEDSHYPITGISDAPNLEGLLEVIEAIMPRLKTLGVMYNPSEANSVATITELRKLLKSKGIHMVEANVNKTNDAPQAVQSLAGKVDALYFPQDNTVIAALPTVVNKAAQLSPQLPIILPISIDAPMILKNILVSVGYDYANIGKETGMMVARILRGENISQIPIQTPTQLNVTINATMAKKLGLSIPTKLLFAKVKIFE